MMRKPFSLLAAVVLSILVAYINLTKAPKNFLSWDVFGYYLYLPQAFIYDDLTVKDYEGAAKRHKQNNPNSTFYQVYGLKNGNHVMKYTSGMAVLYAPFFAVAHQWAKAGGYPADGYSEPYQKMVFWGCIFYSALGIWLLWALLGRYFSQAIVIASMALIVLATNYFIHVGMRGGNGMTHNPLFTLYALVLLCTARWHERPSWLDTVGMGLGCGLAILVRPSEGVCLLIPLLWGISSKETFLQKMRKMWDQKWQILTFALLVFGVVSIQLLYWKLVTGKFLDSSYGGNPGEGLDLNRPHLIDFLFSYRKGWFVYTPIMLFGVLGLFLMNRIQKGISPALLLFSLVNVYVISCWTCWWYAGSFSQRPMISTYPLFALGIGAFLSWVMTQRLVWRITSVAAVVMCLLLNQFQIHQFRLGIIDPERMTGKYYWKSFLRSQKDPEWEKDLLVRRQGHGDTMPQFPELYATRLFKVTDVPAGHVTADTFAYSPPLSSMISKTHEYSMSFECPMDSMLTKDHAWIRVSVRIFPEDTIAVQNLNMILQTKHGDGAYAYASHSIDPKKLKVKQWNNITYRYLTPELRDRKDKFCTFVWLRADSRAWVDDFTIELSERVD